MIVLRFYGFWISDDHKTYDWKSYGCLMGVCLLLLLTLVRTDTCPQTYWHLSTAPLTLVHLITLVLWPTDTIARSDTCPQTYWKLSVLALVRKTTVTCPYWHLSTDLLTLVHRPTDTCSYWHLSTQTYWHLSVLTLVHRSIDTCPYWHLSTDLLTLVHRPTDTCPPPLSLFLNSGVPSKRCR